MSNIFDAFRKSSVIDFDQICPDEQTDQGLPWADKQLDPAADPPSIPTNCSRVVRLRVSTISPVFPFEGTPLAAAEQYRIIRTKLLHNPKKPQLVLISSSCSGDGKTVTSINIAGSLALKAESRILLVDGDLRHSRVAEELDIPQVPGLTDVLTGKIQLDEAILRAEQFPNLSILTAGTLANNAAELLDSPQWSALLGQVRTRFANVIFDGPPVATVADYELLQHGCDGVILVIRPDHSDRAACLNALGTVPKQKLLGVVLNCTQDWWLWKTPGYGYYRSASSETVADTQTALNEGT